MMCLKSKTNLMSILLTWALFRRIQISEMLQKLSKDKFGEFESSADFGGQSDPNLAPDFTIATEKGDMHITSIMEDVVSPWRNVKREL